jgi:MoaA/NifB/PqqE/SkfB family radical SAM enzyme
MPALKALRLRFLVVNALRAAWVIVRFSTIKKLINLIRCSIDYRLLRARPMSHPIEAQMEPTNMCNLSCPYCRTGAGEDGGAPGKMGLADFKGYVDALGDYLYMVSLFAHGEPFLNGDLTSMIAYSRSRKIATSVHSNLNVPLREEDAAELVGSGLNFLSVSIDGATQGTYSKYRVGGDLERVLKNIELINGHKRRLGSREPMLVWQYLLFRHNEHEVESAARMARQRGMEFNIGRPNAPDDDRSAFFAGRRTHRDGRRCRYPWMRIHINYDGSVAPCCLAYYRKDLVGAFDCNRPDDVWRGAGLEGYRRYLGGSARDNPAPGVLCGGCPEDAYWKAAR